MTESFIGMLVKEIYDHFIEWNILNGKAKNTIKVYEGRLKRFVEEFGHREYETLKPLEVNTHLLRVGLEQAPDTRRMNIICFERLQNWVVAMELCDRKICKDKIEKPPGRQRERLPTDEEFAVIKSRADYDFLLPYCSLLQCGARPGELCGATIEQIDRDNRVIVIENHKTRNKTQKPRLIPIGTRLLEMLDQAIGDRDSGRIFLRADGTPWESNSLSRTFSRIRDSARLPKELVLYLTRHWHATKLCQQVSLVAAAKALNHTNTRTTEKYVKTSIEEMRSNQDLVFS